MEKIIEVGRIVKPQGIKGEVKIVPYVNNIQAFRSLKYLYVNGKKQDIASARVGGCDVFVCFLGVEDRNQAEELRGAVLSLERDIAEVFAGDGYFIDDLIGLNVFVGDENVGTVRSITNSGSADVFYVEGEKKLAFPYVKKFVTPCPQDGKIVIDPVGFRQIVLYED